VIENLSVYSKELG